MDQMNLTIGVRLTVARVELCSLVRSSWTPDAAAIRIEEPDSVEKWDKGCSVGQ